MLGCFEVISTSILFAPPSFSALLALLLSLCAPISSLFLAHVHCYDSLLLISHFIYSNSP